MLNYSRLPPDIERILEAAHWAPSGDNAQPWRFAVHSERRLELLVLIEPGNVYEYRHGEPTLISAGTLLENIAIAAPSFGLKAGWEYLGPANGNHRIQIDFLEDPAASENPLMREIERRSVDRRPYQTAPLTPEQRRTLSQVVGPEFSVEWHESLAARRKIAALTRLATDIRLRIPETFAIHNRIVDWRRSLSPDGIPARALGLDAMTLKIMRWTLQKRQRTEMANRLGSPFFAGLQMDVLPGIFSAAYFALRLQQRFTDPGDTVRQLLRVGQAVQRFWLTATQSGLVMQPCLAALAFTHYGASGEAFTVSQPERRKAALLARRVARDLSDPPSLAFLGRIGMPVKARQESRSLRRPLAELVQS
ncbi:MAG TPA: nitroreductase family protein [Rhizomicrobium sp.]|nr:nitroreductase family protein [Rhizomicrobium sp.]